MVTLRGVENLFTLRGYEALLSNLTINLKATVWKRDLQTELPDAYLVKFFTPWGCGGGVGGVKNI